MPLPSKWIPPARTRTSRSPGTVALLLWSVRNQFGADGLPAEAWAAAADALLRAETTVQSAKVVATHEEDELALDGTHICGLSVAVVIKAADAGSATGLVERLVVEALWSVLGDREAAWTAYDWQARAG